MLQRSSVGVFVSLWRRRRGRKDGAIGDGMWSGKSNCCSGRCAFFLSLSPFLSLVLLLFLFARIVPPLALWRQSHLPLISSPAIIRAFPALCACRLVLILLFLLFFFVFSFVLFILFFTLIPRCSSLPMLHICFLSFVSLIPFTTIYFSFSVSLIPSCVFFQGFLRLTLLLYSYLASFISIQPSLLLAFLRSLFFFTSFPPLLLLLVLFLKRFVRPTCFNVIYECIFLFLAPCIDLLRRLSVQSVRSNLGFAHSVTVIICFRREGPLLLLARPTLHVLLYIFLSAFYSLIWQWSFVVCFRLLRSGGCGKLHVERDMGGIC